MDKIIKETNRTRILFDEIRALNLEPAYFLKTRVLAELRERRRGKEMRFWKILALVTSAVSVVVVILATSLFRGQTFQARIGEKVAIRIELEQIKDQTVAFAEIELPDGVEFYSERHPELSERRQLRIGWNRNRDGAKFPLVIRSSDSGVKLIHVRLLDSESHEVSEQEVRIEFNV